MTALIELMAPAREKFWCGLSGALLSAWANDMPVQSRGRNAAGVLGKAPIAPRILKLVSHANGDKVSINFPAALALPKAR
jgi:hypothetical protein